MLQVISISKTVCHCFWPGLIAGAEFWGRLFLDIINALEMNTLELATICGKL
jgi:hypothetical protein